MIRPRRMRCTAWQRLVRRTDHAMEQLIIECVRLEVRRGVLPTLADLRHIALDVGKDCRACVRATACDKAVARHVDGTIVKDEAAHQHNERCPVHPIA